MNGQNFARAYDLETGKELWRCGGQAQRPIASAVAADGLVFVGSGFQGSFLGAFRLNGHGDIEKTDQVAWTTSRDAPDVASPLLSGGRLYFHKGKTGRLSCVDAQTGKVHYAAIRVPGVAEHLCVTDRRGWVRLRDGPQRNNGRYQGQRPIPNRCQQLRR